MGLSAAFMRRESEQLVRLYSRAARELQAVIHRVRATDFERARATDLLRQVEEILQRLRRDQTTWARGVIPRAYREGVLLTARALQTTPPPFAQVHRAAVEAIATQLALDTDRAVGSIHRELGRVFIRAQQAIVSQQALLEEVGVGVVRGLAPRELARRIAQTLQDGATARLRGVVDDALRADLQATAEGRLIAITGKDGITRRYPLDWYAETVALSTTRMAASEGVLQTSRQYGNDLVQVSVHSQACPICVPYQGKVYSISGEHPDFPKLAAVPPLHPRCRHVLLPAPEAFLRRRGLYEGLAEWSRGDARVGSVAEYRDLLASIQRGVPPVPRAVPTALPPTPEEALIRGIEQLATAWRARTGPGEPPTVAFRGVQLSNRVAADLGANGYYDWPTGTIFFARELSDLYRQLLDLGAVRAALAPYRAWAEAFLRRQFGVGLESATRGQLVAAYIEARGAPVQNQIRTIAHEAAHAVVPRRQQWEQYDWQRWTAVFQEAVTELWARLRWWEAAEAVFGAPRAALSRAFTGQGSYLVEVRGLLQYLEVVGVRGGEVESVVETLKFRVPIQERAHWLARLAGSRLQLSESLVLEIEAALEDLAIGNEPAWARVIDRVQEAIRAMRQRQPAEVR